MTKVLCFGSLNIDYVYKLDHFVKKGETISSEALNVYCGGKGLNQSVALGKAGCQVYHAGKIGKDGEFLLDVLKDGNVDITNVVVSESERSGNAIIQNDRAGDNCIILYPGANRSITTEMVDQVLSGFSEGDYLILQNEINQLEYIVRTASEKGMVIVLNPSPFDEKLTQAIFEKTDYFILNEVEAMQLTGCASDDVDSLSAALKNCLPNAHFVLTLGEKGSCYIDKENMFFQDIFKVDTVDTTAAGDTFSGYFISCLIKGLTIPECLRMAAKASSIAVSRPGAAPSIPWMSEVEYSA